MMQRCRIGKAHRVIDRPRTKTKRIIFYSDRATAAHMCYAVSTGTIGSNFTIGHVGAPRLTRKLTS